MGTDRRDAEPIDSGSYGDHWADHYDEMYGPIDDVVIDLLAGLSGAPPRALELGVGTGRIALPLRSRGVEVAGIEISARMVERLRSKPGGAELEVLLGDFADVAVDRAFPLIYLPFNTLFALPSQERQVQCFQNVARRLEPGGRFVLDCFVPNPARFDLENSRIGVFGLRPDGEHSIEVSVHRPLAQRISTHVMRMTPDGATVVLPIELRYAWPSEIDLMARLAGLELEQRWSWYDRAPFGQGSDQHVSVYRRP